MERARAVRLADLATPAWGGQRVLGTVAGMWSLRSGWSGARAAGVVAAALAVGAVAVAGTAAAAAYTDPAQTAQQLRSTHVVVADDAETRGQIDIARLQQNLGSAAHIYVAVLPARALTGTPEQTAAAVGAALGDDSAVVVVAVGPQIGAAQGPRAPLPPGDARRVAASHNSGSDVQAALEATITQIRRDGSNTNPGQATNASPTSSGTGSGVLVVLVVVLLAGAALLVVRRRRAANQGFEQNAGARADVQSMYSRLGSDVATLNTGDDKVAQQAMVDASERYNATGSILADPHAGAAVLAQARRTVIEGIMAARVARQRLNLDPGPDPMPTPPPTAPQVNGHEDVHVDGVSYTGYDQYQPGAGHYFGGGTYQGRTIPGGWYQQPFWQTAAISAIAFGGLGYALGGGFGGDYDEGRGSGDRGDSGGGDAGGGGDWGGGGGDWGGGNN